MKRWGVLIYSVACYGAFHAIYAYLCGFTGNLVVPKSIDTPTATPAAAAAAINVLLLLAFGLQHSIMARPAFKRVWTRVVPEPIERSTYLLASCVALGVLVWQWRAIDGIVWDVQNPVGRGVMWALFAAGWLMVPAVSFMISHGDLFGLRQAWLYFRGREYAALPFRTPALYAHIRHPIYVGWALSFWATPTMTWGHLLFASVLTGYMALAALIEERDLVAHFGRRYEEYMQAVPRYVPRLERLAGGPEKPSASSSRLAGDDPAVGA
jgi:protein-S-isoprenylcysteine O-methyltransferase Ste14